MDSIVVDIDELTIGYSKQNPLVEIPRLEISSGEIIAITGPSGVGKTTLIRTISGLVRPLKGKVSLFGQPFGVRPKRGSLGYIPQRLGLVRHASVFHNVMLGARAGNSSPTVYSLIVKSEIHAWILSVGWDYPRSYTNQLEDFQGSAEKSSNCKGYGAVAKNYSRG